MQCKSNVRLYKDYLTTVNMSAGAKKSSNKKSKREFPGIKSPEMPIECGERLQLLLGWGLLISFNNECVLISTVATFSSNLSFKFLSFMISLCTTLLVDGTYCFVLIIKVFQLICLLLFAHVRRLPETKSLVYTSH